MHKRNPFDPTQPEDNLFYLYIPLTNHLITTWCGRVGGNPGWVWVTYIYSRAGSVWPNLTHCHTTSQTQSLTI